MIVLIALVVLIAVLLTRTAIVCVKARKLSPSQFSCSEETLQKHGDGLSAFIQCQTVSHKDSYDDTEFAKLRLVVRERFPLLHQQAEYQVFGSDCWMYKIPGKDPSRNIMLMSHHDVVEAGEGWTYPPFGGVVDEGRLYGRGTVDTKSPLYAQMAAMEALLKTGFQPECNVYIGSSHNEETSGDGFPKAVAYFKEQGITFEVVMDEGGAVVDAPLGGMKCKKCAMVAVHEKGRYRLNCTATAASSHTSLNGAGAANVNERMAFFIRDVQRTKPFIRRLNPQMKAMFTALAPYCSAPMRVLFSNLWLFGGLLTALLPKISPQAGGMIGTSCVFNKIQGESVKNSCTCTALLRSVDRADMEKDLAAFYAIAKKYDIQVQADPTAAYFDPADLSRPAYAYTMDRIAHHFPDAPAAPMILTAGSDARYMAEVCDCVLRFTPIRLSKAQLSSVHAKDENIDLSTVAEAVAFYKDYVASYR